MSIPVRSGSSSGAGVSSLRRSEDLDLSPSLPNETKHHSTITLNRRGSKSPAQSTCNGDTRPEPVMLEIRGLGLYMGSGSPANTDGDRKDGDDRGLVNGDQSYGVSSAHSRNSSVTGAFDTATLSPDVRISILPFRRQLSDEAEGGELKKTGGTLERDHVELPEKVTTPFESYTTTKSPGTPYLRNPSEGVRTNGSLAFAKAYAANMFLRTRLKSLARLVPSTVQNLDPSLYGFFLLSIALTISNKYLLRGFFPFPWILTSVQMFCGTIGTLTASKIGAYRPVRLSIGNDRLLKIISLLFSCDILASNLSLRLVTVPFHLSVRALSPAVTLLLSVMFFHQQTTLRASSWLLLVALGVVFTSHNLELTSIGSMLTLAGMLLSSARSIVTTRLLYDQFKLHPLDLLARMNPLGMLHVAVFAIINGELGKFARFAMGPDFTKGHLGAILANGIISFLVFAVGLSCEKRTKAPSMAISSHASTALTVVISVFVFGLSLSVTNFVGVALTLAGSVLYAVFEAMDLQLITQDSTIAPPMEEKSTTRLA